MDVLQNFKKIRLAKTVLSFFRAAELRCFAFFALHGDDR